MRSERREREIALLFGALAGVAVVLALALAGLWVSGVLDRPPGQPATPATAL